MTRTSTTVTAARSRRRFLKVAALGSAAALVTATLPGAGDAATTRRGARPKPAPAPAVPPPPQPSAIEAEVAKQKKSTADLVKTIRDFELPPGSEQAFAFAAAKAGKRRTLPRGGAR